MGDGEALPYVKDTLSVTCGGVGPSQIIGSHSAKVTMLSWATKRGLRVEHRRLLGQHAKSKVISVNTYARDALAHALVQLVMMVTDIMKGCFNPGSSRAEYVSAAVRESAHSSGSVTVSKGPCEEPANGLGTNIASDDSLDDGQPVHLLSEDSDSSSSTAVASLHHLARAVECHCS
eukprot:6479576-Amphidinium_carterae.1